MRLRIIAAPLLASALALGSASAFAQGIITGSVNGTVADPSGALVPNASIVATEINTGIKQTVTTSKAGEFSFNTLPVGTYTINITSPGFDTLSIGGVIVTTGQANGLGLEKLKTGTAVESVEVNTGESLLETVQSQVSTTFTSEQIQNLPTGGGFDELALLIPGVVSTRSNNFSNTNGAGISSNGQRGRSNNFEIDGQSNNDNSVAGPQVFFSNSDALSEVQIITDNFSAQYGRDAGSVVNYITKSGTNAYHGTAFEYYEGSWLSSLTQGQKSPVFGYGTPAQVAAGCVAAGTCILPHKPRFTDNSFGGTFGGPILKDKLFGFGSAEFQRNFSGQTILNSGSVGATTGYTPTPAGVAQLVAALPNNPGIQSLSQFGPYSLSGGGAGTVNQIPGSTLYTNFSDGTTTVANVPVSLYSRTINPYNTDEEVLGRLDYQATPNDRFFLRYFYQNSPSVPYNQTVTGGIVYLTDKAHSVGADWSHTFGPRIVNQLRYSFQQATLLFQGGVFPNCTSANFSGCPASLGVSTASAYKQAAFSAPGGATANTITAISSFGLSTSYPQGRIVKDTQAQDNLTLTFGKHSMTVGGSFEYQNSPNTFLPNISGGYTLNGGNGVTQGVGTLGLAVGNPGIHFTEPDIAAYFQDDWKVTPSFTANIGIRWEFFSQSINILHNLSVASQTGSVPLWNPSLPLAQTTFPSVPQSYKHFEPRIGFAYNPSALKQLVIRGGYSVNIAPAFYNIFLNSYGSAPVVLAGTIAGCSNATKACIPGGGAYFPSVHALGNPYLTGSPTTNINNPGAYNQTFVGGNFNQPITQTYQLGIQYEVGRFAVVEARYVGAHTSKDFQSVNTNPYIGATAKADFPNYFGNVSICGASTLPTGTGPNAGLDVGRLNCGQTFVRTRQNTAFEIYNGLQTQITTRNYHGLTANLAYTFSRTIDNASEIFSTEGSVPPFAQNPLDPNVGERGVSANSFPNVTSLGLTYVDPHFKSNHSLIGKALGGFQLNTIYLFNSGQPFTPYQALEGSFCDTNFNNAFDGAVDTCRPVLSNPNAPSGSVGFQGANHLYYKAGTGTQNIASAINPTSVRYLYNNVAEALTLGNPYPGIGRNKLRGDSFNNVQASVFKNNKINERFNMQLQVTAFNLMNRGYYGVPDPLIEDAGGSLPTFNTVIANGGTNRNVQIGARLLF